jgi:hypothetical protein
VEKRRTMTLISLTDLLSNNIQIALSTPKSLGTLGVAL